MLQGIMVLKKNRVQPKLHPVSFLPIKLQRGLGHYYVLKLSGLPLFLDRFRTCRLRVLYMRGHVGRLHEDPNLHLPQSQHYGR